MLKRLFLHFTILLSLPAFGQADGLTKGNMEVTGAFKNLAKVDSFSRLNDSLNAGIWLLKVDPYIFDWWCFDGRTPEDILKGYAITNSIAVTYMAIYNNAMLHASKTYNTFRKMREEDREVRKMLEQCSDSLSAIELNRRLKETDSMHFNYLYQYVKKNGWPTIPNGSLQAGLIAIHDVSRHVYYAQVIKKATEEGQASKELFMYMLHWQHMDKDYEELSRLFDTAKTMRFDVSSLFDGKLPSSLPDIQKAVRQHCPGTWHLMFESPELKDYEEWIKKIDYPNKMGIVGKLSNELWEVCPREGSEEGNAAFTNKTQIRWRPAKNKKPRIMLYVFY